MAEVTLHGSTALSPIGMTSTTADVEVNSCAWDSTATVTLLGVRLYQTGAYAGVVVTLGVIQPGVAPADLGAASATPTASGTVTMPSAPGWVEVRFASPLTVTPGRFVAFARNAAVAGSVVRFSTTDNTRRPTAGAPVGSTGVSLAPMADQTGKLPLGRRGRATYASSAWTTSTLQDAPLDVILDSPVQEVVSTLLVTGEPVALAGTVAAPAPVAVAGNVPPPIVAVSVAIAPVGATPVAASAAAASVALAGAVVAPPPAAVAGQVSVPSVTFTPAVAATGPTPVTAGVVVEAPTAAGGVSAGAATVVVAVVPTASTLVGAVVHRGAYSTGRVVCTVARLTSADGTLVGLPSGEVTLTALADQVRAGGKLVAADRVVCRISDGVLYGPDGTVGVDLLATDSPGVSPSVVQYRATWALHGVRKQPASVVFDVLAGGVVDLATVVPATVQPGVERVILDPQGVIDVAVAEAEHAAQAAAQDLLLDLDPVLTVNGVAPDADGNVEIEAGGGEGTVTSVNGVTPDVSGNVTIPTGAGAVRTVNGAAPDGAGNVAVGTVRTVNGVPADSAGGVAIPTGTTNADSYGLPTPRVERFDVVVQGVLAVGTTTTFIRLPAGRVKRLATATTSATQSTIAYVQATIGGAGVWANPRYAGSDTALDVPVTDGAALGVQVTSISGAGVVTDLVVSCWVLVQ